MNMRDPIVLVVGTKDCLQTNYGNVVHCCTKFHVCQLFISTWITLIFIWHTSTVTFSICL